MLSSLIISPQIHLYKCRFERHRFDSVLAFVYSENAEIASFQHLQKLSWAVVTGLIEPLSCGLKSMEIAWG
jgi:hypothetical protein